MDSVLQPRCTLAMRLSYTNRIAEGEITLVKSPPNYHAHDTAIENAAELLDIGERGNAS